MSSTATLKMLLLGEDRGATKTLHGVSNAADQAEHHASRLHRAFKLAAGAAIGVGAFEGIRKGAEFLKSAAEAGAEDEQAQARLAKAMQNSAGATKGQIAATESWITKQGQALGVADDDLRPALVRLVASTHDVGKAQKLASLAMDVSAGTGKSLSAVAMALGKAQDGNTAGLSRLGVKTKDAAGHTLSLKAVTKELADTYGGQAKTKANTFQGKLDRVKLALSEMKESIGQKLLPMIAKLATWFITKAVPALEKFGHQLKSGQGMVGVFGHALGLIKNAAAGTISFLAHHRAIIVALVAAYTAFKVAQLAMAVASGISLIALKAQTVGTVEQTVVSKAAAAASKVWAAAQWLLNVALDANPIGLVVIAIAALVAGFIYAYKHSETFRRIVNAVFSAIKNVAGPVLRWLGHAVVNTVDAVVAAWKHVKSATVTAWNATVGFVKAIPGRILDFFKKWTIVGIIASHWTQIKAKTISIATAIVTWVKGLPGRIITALASLGSRLATVGKTAFGMMKDQAANKVGDLVRFANSIPGKIVHAIGRLGRLLYNAGAALISGLINGITDKARALWNKVSGLASKIKGFFPGSPVKHGPLTSWNNGGAGKRLVGMLADGLSNTAPVDTAMQRLTRGVAAGGGGFAAGGARGGTGGGDLGTVTFVLKGDDGKVIEKKLLTLKRQRGGVARLAFEAAP